MPVVGGVAGNPTEIVCPESDSVVGVLTGFLHTLVVLHPELVVHWLLHKLALAASLMTCSSCLVLVLVASIEI